MALTDAGVGEPLPVLLGPWTLEESLCRLVQSKDALDRLDIRAARDMLLPPLSLVLYLCSEAPELRGPDGEIFTGGRPSPQKTKAGWRSFPPDKVTRVAVGGDIARQIREAATTDEAQPHKGPRPHIRRAHWHGYWLGPRAGDRRFELRWIAPMAVALKEEEKI